MSSKPSAAARRGPFDWRAHWHLVRRFAANLVQDFLGHSCQKSAAALTYMTLFAIVPLMTVIYSVFSVVPAFDGVAEKLQALIFTNFVPETGQEIQSYLADFSSQARSLTGAGIGMLVVTAYLMLTNIEKSFNDIWGVTQPRRGLSSFLLYWAVLSLGPLLLGVGFAVNTYLLSLKLVLNEYNTLGLAAVFYRVLPWIMEAAAFTLLFAAVPNCRVPMKYAVIGGAITALCFEVLKVAFSSLMKNSNFQLIYGAFAVVPLFLLWVNLVWTVILAGAIVVRTLAEKQYAIVEGRVTDMVAALKCLALFRARGQHGGRVTDGDCYRLGLGVVHWQYLREKFVSHRWISVTEGGNYVLCRDLRTVTLTDLARLVQLKIDDLDAQIAKPPQASWYQYYLDRRARVAEAVGEHFNVSLEQLLLDGPNAEPAAASQPRLERLQ